MLWLMLLAAAPPAPPASPPMDPDRQALVGDPDAPAPEEVMRAEALALEGEVLRREPSARYAEAAAASERYLAFYASAPDAGRVRAVRGAALLGLGRPEEAYPILAAAPGPDAAKDAIEAAWAALERPEASPDARAYWRERLLEALDRAEPRYPEAARSDIAEHAAQALLREGRAAEALPHLLPRIEADPGSEDAHRAILAVTRALERQQDWPALEQAAADLLAIPGVAAGRLGADLGRLREQAAYEQVADLAASRDLAAAAAGLDFAARFPGSELAAPALCLAQHEARYAYQRRLYRKARRALWERFPAFPCGEG